MRWAQRRYFARSRRGQPALALPRLPQAQDRSGQVAGEVPVGVLVGLARRTAIARSEPRVAADVSVAVQPGACSAAGTGNPRLMVVPCRHEVPDSSGRRCALCGACLKGTSPSPARAHGLPAGTAPRRLSDGERRELAPTRKCLSAHILAENFTTKLTRTVPPPLLIQCSRRDGDYDLMQIGKRVVF